MKIDSIKTDTTCMQTFGINYNSKKLRFKPEDFYVRIRGYGTNQTWAYKIIETADEAAKFIRKHCNFEETLKMITIGVADANQNSLDLTKRKHSGILRIERDGWKHGSDWDSKYGIITRYDGCRYKNKYNIYTDRFEYIYKHPLKNPYHDIHLTRPRHDKDYYGKFLDHGCAKSINNAFKHIEQIYNDIYYKYIQKEPTNADLDTINKSIAEIRWILAHSTPFERGSDAISNTFIRAFYKAIGIKLSPLKKGVSLDLEAYCTELIDYKKNFVEYFSRKPYIVE